MTTMIMSRQLSVKPMNLARQRQKRLVRGHLNGFPIGTARFCCLVRQPTQYVTHAGTKPPALHEHLGALQPTDTGSIEGAVRVLL